MFLYLGLDVRCAISPPFTKTHLALSSNTKIEPSCFPSVSVFLDRKWVKCDGHTGGPPRAPDLLVVLPEWLVRRTRPGWDYWLQRIGVSEQEVYLFSPTAVVVF